MCVSVMKFESKRPGTISDWRDSLPRVQYSHTIYLLNTESVGYFQSNDGIEFFSEKGEHRDLTANSEYRLGKETLLNDNPIFSNILNTSKPRLTTIIKRNKTRHKSVNIGNRISFFQVL